MLISIETWMLLLLIELMFDKNVFVGMEFQIPLHWKYWLWWLSVQFNSVAQSCPTPCDPINCSTPGLPVHHQFPEFTQTHVHRVSDAIQPSHPLSSPSPPAPNLSQHQSLSNEWTLRMRWPKYWSFSFSIIPSKEQPGLISFRMDWLDLLAVQRTLNTWGQLITKLYDALWCFFSALTSALNLSRHKVTITNVQK